MHPIFTSIAIAGPETVLTLGSLAALMLGTSASVRYEPRGRCLIISPWNYPLTLAVSDAMPALLAGNRQRLASLRLAAGSAANAALLARQRYSSGLIDFQTVLDTQRTLLSAQDNLKSTEAEQASALIRLYKALGGFATNGVNMTKLESYMVGGSFTATEFYADIEGHPDDANVKLALDELSYFTSQFNLLGVYPADRNRG